MESNVFEHDKYLMRQKHFSISEKYILTDEQGHDIIFVKRPAKIIKSLLSILAGLLVFSLVGTGCVFLGMALFSSDSSINLILVMVAFSVILSVGLMILVIVRLYPLRHISIHEDKEMKQVRLAISQDVKFAWLNSYFTLYDARTQEKLARFRKNWIMHMIRKKWDVLDGENNLIAQAWEDSMLKAFLRRFLGYLYGVLRTNFVINSPEGNKLGEFNRRFTILDRYVLDLTFDKARYLDRRIAVTLGILLDTGERR